MNYEDIRPKIQSGDIIALSHYKWASLYDLQIQAVRVFTQSEYSHVSMVLRMDGRVYVVESVIPFVRLVPLSNFVKEGFYLLQAHTPVTDSEQTFIDSKIGIAHYSKWQAILAFFRKLKIGADNLFECAEFVICSRRLSGLDLGSVATPSALVKYALNKGMQLEYVGGNEDLH